MSLLSDSYRTLEATTVHPSDLDCLESPHGISKGELLETVQKSCTNNVPPKSMVHYRSRCPHTARRLMLFQNRFLKCNMALVTIELISILKEQCTM